MKTENVEAILQGRERQPHQLIEALLEYRKTMVLFLKKPCGPSRRRYRCLSSRYTASQIFYKVMSLVPRGKHLITICMGTACHVRTAALLFDEVFYQLGVGPSRTSDDGLFSVERVNCLGACALGPIVVLDGVYHHHMTPSKLRKIIRSVRSAEKEVMADA